MGTYADPNGIELVFLEKDGKTKRPPYNVSGKGKLYSRPRTAITHLPDPDVPNYELGSSDWLTDIIVAPTDKELSQIKPTHDECSLTSACSRKVCVQYKLGQEVQKEENCVTLACVDHNTREADGRMPTSKIYIFPDGTEFPPGHPMEKQWRGTVDMLRLLAR